MTTKSLTVNLNDVDFEVTGTYYPPEPQTTDSEGHWGLFELENALVGGYDLVQMLDDTTYRNLETKARNFLNDY